MSEQRRYVRMATVFPIELEIIRENGEKCSPHVFQAFTRDIGAGGMCLELKSFGRETEKLLSIPHTHLSLTINTTFAKHPIRAIARIVWLSRKDEPLPVRYLIGVSYTQIDPKAKKRILKHAKRLLWVPRLTAAIGIAAAVLLIGFSFYNQNLIAENRALVYQLLDSAARKSDVAVNLYELQKRKSLLDKELLKSQTQIKNMESAIASLTSENAAQKQDFEKKLAEGQAKEKAIHEELKALKEGQQKLETSYQDLQKSGTLASATVLRQMYGWIHSHQNLRTGLVSSFEGDEGLEDWGFTYDQSLVCQAYLVFGDVKNAAAILSFYETRAATEGGAYHNAYDIADGRVVENAVHVGPNVWIGIAALQYQHKTRDGRFLPIARRIADWVTALQDEEGGVRGGPQLNWYSTEHNLNAYAFFLMLYNETADTKYKQASDHVLSWLKKYAYTVKEKRMSRGKGDATIATDTFSWAIAAVGPETLTRTDFDAEAIMEFAEQHCEVDISYKQPDGKMTKVRGFDFAKAQNVGRGGIISTEWTAQAVVTYRILSDYFKAIGDPEKASLYLYKVNLYLNELQKLVITSPSRTGQGRGCLPYASHDNVDTGHGWRTPKGKRTGSVAATAYGIFAWTGYNPFQLDNKTEVV